MARRQVVRQSDFGFGELSEDYAASNVEAKTRSLKSGLNTRILNSYSAAQRFGSRRMATVAGSSINFEVVTSSGTVRIGVIRASGVDIYNEDGSLLQSVSGAPWSESEISELTWHARQDEVYFTHTSYWPRVMTYVDGVWSLALYEFGSGAGNSSQQLYFRFADPGISIAPSGTTGSITVQFSEDVLVAGHVGVRFRYGATLVSAKEIQIDTVVDAQNATATVLDTLPPTYDVTVADASGYRVGEDVEGQDSGATGVITAIAGNVLTVLMADNFTSFLTGSDAEYVVGPFHRSKVASLAAASAPAASTVWDEAVLSPARGYPGDVFERSGRLGFADFPQIPGGVALSAPGARSIFDVGRGEAQDAIFFLLAEGGQRVRYCVSAANLIILTDRRAYYVPEDDSIPLAANTFKPIEVGPTGASSAFPVAVDEGVVYVESGGNRVMGLLATGDMSAPFKLTDLSRHADHLIKTPVSLAMTTGNAQAPERYIFALNEDGTLTCMFFDTNPPRLGLTPWETDGAYLAMVPIRGIIYAICRREVAGVNVYFLERLDADSQMDASSLFSLSGSYLPITDDNGDPITGDDGEAILSDIGVMPHLAGQTVKVIRGTEFLGEMTVGANGILSIDADDGDFEAGLHFEVDMTLWPPEAEGDNRTMFARRRVSHVAVRTRESGSYTVGLEGRSQFNTRPPYDQGDDTEEDPPLRTEVRRYALAGYEHEPCIQITRPIPTPLTVLSVAQEVIVT